MGWILLANVVLPVLIGIAVVILVSATASVPSGLEQYTDIALNWAILGLALTGQLFANSRVASAFGSNTPLLGILVFCVDFILAGILVYRRSRLDKPESDPRHVEPDRKHAFLSLVIGLGSIIFTCGIFVWLYGH